MTALSWERTPLPEDSLPVGVRRATAASAPLPARTALARGLLPMGPLDLCVALYQLTFDGEQAIREAAQNTASELPDRILVPALAGALHPHVLDFYAERLKGREPLLEPIVLNTATDAQTICTITREASERLCELVAVNEDRLLRAPAILEALYFNRQARMSTVDRLVDLASRHGVVIASIPALRKGEEGSSSATVAPATEDAANFFGDEIDDLFRAAASMGDDFSIGAPLEKEEEELAEGGELEDSQPALEEPKGAQKPVQIGKLPINSRIRLATIGNTFHRAILVQDTNLIVAMAAIRSPAINGNEVVRYSSMRNVDEEVIRYIGERKEWLRLYSVKKNLVNNPKCPLMMATKLLVHLRANDLRALARSKNVASALAKAAKQRLISQTR